LWGWLARKDSNLRSPDPESDNPNRARGPISVLRPTVHAVSFGECQANTPGRVLRTSEIAKESGELVCAGPILLPNLCLGLAAGGQEGWPDQAVFHPRCLGDILKVEHIGLEPPEIGPRSTSAGLAPGRDRVEAILGPAEPMDGLMSIIDRSQGPSTGVGIRVYRARHLVPFRRRVQLSNAARIGPSLDSRAIDDEVEVAP
jgi:hypothetical protein